MIKVVFKDIDWSENMENFIKHRLGVVSKHVPKLSACRSTITASMKNCGHKVGPDVFVIRMFVSNDPYKGIVLEKDSSNVVVVLVDHVHHLTERLKHLGDKTRIKGLHDTREFKFNQYQLSNVS